MTWIVIHKPIIKTRNTSVKYTMKVKPQDVDCRVTVTMGGAEVVNIETMTIKKL